MENMQKQVFLPLPSVSPTLDMHGHNEVCKADAIDKFLFEIGNFISNNDIHCYPCKDAGQLNVTC